MPIDVGAPYDNLPAAELKERVLAFASNPIEERWNRSLLGQYVNTVIPRSIFLRNACVDAHILDLGAGDGGLAIFKSWPFVTRPDLRMHAVSLEVGERFELYEDYEISNFEQALPDFGGMQFDSIICSHFIEHLSNPARALQFFGARLKPGGSVYLEWPHPVSKKMPSMTLLQERCINVMTVNFFDDKTHIEAWPMFEIAEGLQAAGLQINTAGRVWLDFLADQLMAHGRMDNNAVDLTYAVWYKFAWAQYLIATKPHPGGTI